MVLVKELTLNCLSSHKSLLTQKPCTVGLFCPISEGVKTQPVTFVPSTGLFKKTVGCSGFTPVSHTCEVSSTSTTGGKA